MTLHFKWHSILSDNLLWVTFYFEWHSLLNNIPFWVTFNFEWHSILSDIPFWVTFCFKLHSILVTFHFEWHFILSDISFWVKFHFECINLNDENWGSTGLSISNLYVSQSVSQSRSIIRTRDASESKNSGYYLKLLRLHLNTKNGLKWAQKAKQAIFCLKGKKSLPKPYTGARSWPA